MSGGYAELEAFAAGCERLREMNELVAKDAEKPVAKAMRSNVEAAKSPDGKAWPELKGGGKALSGAGAAIKSSVKGNRIVLGIGEPYVFHNHGAGGSSTSKEAVRERKAMAARHSASGTSSKFHAPKRQILPASGEPIPEAVKEAIEESAKRVFEKAMGR